ncbi:Thylakoid lumenal 29 kDa protein [Hibiscus syriacus]|uniref:Thylakoid lumenal 29 kDa protein n=1 Tax=Hibiscus syriacus TaxID=106335 RepID=A0A6A3BSC1_HIBSY|nr:Thylakoid lumenal 29 kDa protein [Hibiscus syriacus]
MRVSFISTTPSLVSLAPVPDPSLYSICTFIAVNRSLSRPGAIRCSKTPPVDVSSESGFHRRGVLKCIGATVGLEFLGSLGSWVEMASAADLIQRRQRSEFLCKFPIYTLVQFHLETAMGNPDIVPSLLTLALNDAVTCDKVSRPENKGLSAAVSLLDETKEIDSYSKGGPISYSDLIQYAAQTAVKSTFLEAAFTNAEGTKRKEEHYMRHMWGLFDRQFGRSDAEEPDPEGRVLLWEKANVQEMKDKFKAISFGLGQLAVMSAFLDPDQNATEALLVTDPNVSPWVQK